MSVNYIERAVLDEFKKKIQPNKVLILLVREELVKQL